MVGKIIDKKEVVQDTLQVSFQIPQEVSFKAGQYMFVTLINPPFTDEKGNRRQFSINNSPNQKNILVMTTRVTDSAFKKSLKQLPLGAEVEIGPIAGVFTLPENPTKPLVFIAGGIGITPFMSMLRYVKEQSLDYKITLVYSNRNQESSAYLDELKELANTLLDLKLILTLTDDTRWMGETSKVDANFIKKYFPNVNDNLYMVVGPPAMVEAVELALKEAGVNQENIKVENFTGY